MLEKANRFNVELFINLIFDRRDLLSPAERNAVSRAFESVYGFSEFFGRYSYDGKGFSLKASNKCTASKQENKTLYSPEKLINETSISNNILNNRSLSLQNNNKVDNKSLQGNGNSDNILDDGCLLVESTNFTDSIDVEAFFYNKSFSYIYDL